METKISRTAATGETTSGSGTRASKSNFPLKKKEAELISPPDDRLLSGQHYRLGVVTLFCQMVLTASVSMAGACKVLKLIDPEKEKLGEIPHATTGRMWLLRFGLHKLQRPKVKADDWVWIVDHAVQVGTEKCLLIAGVRISQLPPSGENLKLQHLEPLAVLPVNKSNGEIVCAQLEELARQVGSPRAILSDEGSDLLSGINLFRALHPGCSKLSDIAHYAARLLKRRLEKDERWQSFCKRASQTKSQTTQTELVLLSPPRQRSKARFMNLNALLSWASKGLFVLGYQPAAVLEHCTAERLEEKFGWLREFRDDLKIWMEYEQLTQSAIMLIRHQGYFSGMKSLVETELMPLSRSDVGKILMAELVEFIVKQSELATVGERLPGSSEVLESSIGRLKYLQGDHQKGGFTQLVLTWAAIVGDRASALIGEALEAVPVKQVKHWCHHHLGTTVQSKRKLAHSSITL